MTLVGYFPLKVNRNLGLQNDAEPTLWKKSLEKRWLRSEMSPWH